MERARAADLAIFDAAPSFAGAASGCDEVVRTLLCADVVGFTRMTERLGDRSALRVMRGVARAVRRAASDWRGQELEIRGDSFLLAFSSPSRALCCAGELQRALARDAAESADAAIELRIALHSGSVICDGPSYFGRNLIVAFRLLSLTPAGQIALTRDVIAQLDPQTVPRLTPAQRFVPKGLRDAVLFSCIDNTRRTRAADAEEGACKKAPTPAGVGVAEAA